MVALSTGAILVFGLIVVAVALFVSETLPPDTTAIAVVVSLVALSPWTGVSTAEAVSGFSSPATLTVVAMYVLSGGIERAGVVRRLGRVLSSVIDGDRDRLLYATVGITGPLAGVINNTPVVAVFVPMITDLADRTRTSPSKLMIPLSYAAMLGGTLTLLGTSTNLVASDLSRRLAVQYPDLRAFTLFEFTHLGVVVLLVGVAYLLTVGQRLLPERVRPRDLTDGYDMSGHLWRLYVREESPLVGATVEEVLGDGEYDLDVLQIVRGEESYVAPGTDQTVQARDRLTVRADEETASAFSATLDLRLMDRASVTEAELDRPEGRGILVDAVVSPGSSLIGHSIEAASLRDRYRATVLAVRRGSDVIHDGLGDVVLNEGDGLLLHATEHTTEHLSEREELVVAAASGVDVESGGEPDGDDLTALLSVAILAAVVALAALGVVPIVIAALGGVVAMVATDVVHPGEAYDDVNWEVIFLLAGVFPLGIALQRTGGAEFLGALVVDAAAMLPPIAVLGLFFLLTGLLASVITPVASVVVVLPIAADAAARIGANGFAFALGVTFAAASAFATPIGYQTNLMVYSPGGYTFADYVRVGAPLQLLLAVVVTIGIAAFWGV